MTDNKNWYAVYTKPRWEKKVAALLTRENVENYCPLNRVQRQWSDRKKIVLEPLFTSYVFVRVSELEHTQLKKTDGIINMVYWLGKPAVIRDSEISMIKSFLDEYSNVKLEKTPININDRVRIVSGPLMDMEGQVLVLKNKSVKIILPSLGYMMYAEVESDNVKLIEAGVLRNYELSKSSQYAVK
jgi:transcription antitermination factor NusG